MYTPEQIDAVNNQRKIAILEKFAPVDQPARRQEVIEKSEPTERFFTEDDLDNFQTSLEKAIDNDTISEQDLEKAHEDLLSLQREERLIGNETVSVFVKR